MQKNATVLGLLLPCTPVQPRDADAQRQLLDRAAVEEVTDLPARQAANRAEGKLPGNMYYVISNERISVQSQTAALYQSSWQTLRKGQDTAISLADSDAPRIAW